MTRAMRIRLRLSEVRQRLNEVAGLEGDDFTDEIRTEAEALQTEYSDLEVRHRAAIVAEGEAADQAGRFAGNDGEAAEVRALRGRVSLRDYLGAASGRVGLMGAPAELNAALEVRSAGEQGGPVVPWSLLEVREAGPELRADASSTTATLDGPELQRPILQRLFGDDGVMAALGVRFDEVPAGRTEWPLLATGSSPAQTAEDAAHDAGAATFSTVTLKPKRLTGRYRFTIEQAAQVAGIEAALRRDLADAVRAAMAQTVVSGAAPDDSNPERIQGLLTKLTAPTAPTAKPTFSHDGAGMAGASTVLDGLHASRESEVAVVLGPASFRIMATVTGGDAVWSVLEILTRRAGSVMASPFIPAPAANVQAGILHGAGPNGGGPAARGDSVAAMWSGGIEMLRDPYSGAGSGQVALTWNGLWDAAVAFRSAAYERVSVYTSLT